MLSFSQSKKELEEKRKSILREIESTTKLIKKTTQIKETTLDRFEAVQSQIEQRQNLLSTLTAEISATDSSTARTADVIASLNRDINGMKDEYSKMIRGAFRRKQLNNPILFILSAESLNQAFRRWLFLRKYDRYRREQAEAIAFTRKILAKKMVSLEEERREKEQLLASIQGQKSTLVVELAQKNTLLQTLKQDETKLQQDLKQKSVAHEQLNKAIENIIQEEIRKKVAESRKPKKKPTPPPPQQETASRPVTPSGNGQAPAKPSPAVNAPAVEQEGATDDEDLPEDNLSADFRKNKGRLPWPVQSGFIARKYGRQPHPSIANIEITNNGIDIRTEERSQVYSTFEGKVAGVQFIPGHDYTVIIQHGNYYTVYSNLREAYVSKGDNVKTKQSIGTVSTNKITGTSELHFELWHQKVRMNPAVWIKK